MKFLGLTPNVSTPTVTETPAPTTDTTTATDDATNRLRRRRGVAATVLAGDSSTVNASSVNAPAASAATKAILGQ